MDAGHVFKDAFDFIFGQNGRHVFSALGAKLVEAGFVHTNVKNVAIEEKDGAEGLILGGRGDLFDGGEVGKELVDFGRAHFFGMALDFAAAQSRVMEEDIFLYPNDVGVAGARGVMFEVDSVAILFEQFFFFRGIG